MSSRLRLDPIALTILQELPSMMSVVIQKVAGTSKLTDNVECQDNEENIISSGDNINEESEDDLKQQ